MLPHEFQVSPILLRERFFSRKKKSGETFSQLASELHTDLSYYIKSRNIDKDFHQLVSLLCADRLKELFPPGCANFILTQEKDGWLDHHELSRVADSYMATHEFENRPPKYNNPRLVDREFKFPTSNQNNKTP